MKSVTMPEAWLGDEGMEIKRQITGMMRLLNDKAGRVYQRVGREGETLKQEPQDLELGWARPPAATANTAPSQEEPQHSSWSHDTAFRPQAPGQYGTRSKTLKMLNTAKTVVKINDVVPPAAGAAEASCCMCNCKSTLQAILQELRTMRKLMQTQKGAQEKQRAQSSISPARSPAPRKRPRKRRSVHKVAPLAAPSKRVPVPASPAPDPNGRRERPSRERLVPAQPNTTAQPAPPPPTEAQPAHYSLIKEPPSTEPEVQLAEDYDVYIPKSQLDSILVNYTRSGSLLFRKLVCAFFDDATLANSLPNGKRKRGLNDNRKGLDQNIVGAIKGRLCPHRRSQAHRHTNPELQTNQRGTGGQINTFPGAHSPVPLLIHTRQLFSNSPWVRRVNDNGEPSQRSTALPTASRGSQDPETGCRSCRTRSSWPGDG
ncbi:BEN domain-containing protein 7 isoform X6 [Megalops cyprinoides]|nr:BEN domain-containing protein 7 isoform X6 [Megalops cyprinoides]